MKSIKLPGRTFQLPSRGLMYQNGELSVAEAEVHVHPLSALDEIDLKNPDRLFNGSAFSAVIASCIPEIKKPTELFGRDVDALMYYMRLVTYGPQFIVNVTHTCENAKSHSYTVDLEKMVQEMKMLDPTEVEKDLTVELPNGQVVKVQPVRFSHMIKLFQMNMAKTDLTSEDTKKNIVFNLTQVIESVDGITNKEQIAEWVSSISTPFQNRIKEAIEKSSEWGPAQTVFLKCRDCGQEMEVELPINPQSFFSE